MKQISLLDWSYTLSANSWSLLASQSLLAWQPASIKTKQDIVISLSNGITVVETKVGKRLDLEFFDLCKDDNGLGYFGGPKSRKVRLCFSATEKIAS